MLAGDQVHFRFGYPQAVDGTRKHIPGKAPTLASSPVQPFERALHGPVVKAPYRRQITGDVVIVVVSPQTPIERFDKDASPQMAIILYPFLDPSAGALQSLA